MKFYDVLVGWVLPIFNLGLLIYFQFRYYQWQRRARLLEKRALLAEHIAWSIVRVSRAVPSLFFPDLPFADPYPENTESLVKAIGAGKPPGPRPS